MQPRWLGLTEAQVRALALAEIQLEAILQAQADDAPNLCTMDSTPTLYSEQISSALGWVGQERLREAAKLGFSVAVVPKPNAPKKPIEGLTIHAVERIEQAIEVVRGL